MGRISKTVGFAACRALGVIAPPDLGIPVLGFHSVENSGTYLSTAIEHFRSGMKRLADQGVRGITMAEASAATCAGQIPDNVVVLTFDDGLSSFGEQAWPIMRAFGHGGTLFVPVDFVGGTASWLKDYGLPPMRSHTWDALRALRDDGVDIQSHGCRHPKLTTLDALSLHEDVARSREILERELGVVIEHFCYPFGDFNDAVIEAVRDCGYVSAVTTDVGPWCPGSNPFTIPRNCLDVVDLHDPAFSKRVIDACLDGSFSRYVTMRDHLRAMVGMKWEPPCGE